MKKVLIIDDSPTEAVQLKTILEKNGFEVITVENGADGVAFVRKELPDIVLMDVVMPGLNGFQATRQITHGDETSHIPVIIVTNKNQEADRMWGERQGAKAFLTKPVKESKLVATIEDVLTD